MSFVHKKGRERLDNLYNIFTVPDDRFYTYNEIGELTGKR